MQVDTAVVRCRWTGVRFRGMDEDLTDRQRAMLAFEGRWWKYEGAKETAIREEFDCSATRYYQELRHLIDLPSALIADPMLIKRLRRLRDTRAQARTARRSG